MGSPFRLKHHLELARAVAQENQVGLVRMATVSVQKDKKLPSQSFYTNLKKTFILQTDIKNDGLEAVLT
jgi:hypothetical protein